MIKKGGESLNTILVLYLHLHVISFSFNAFLLIKLMSIIKDERETVLSQLKAYEKLHEKDCIENLSKYEKKLNENLKEVSEFKSNLMKINKF